MTVAGGGTAQDGFPARQAELVEPAGLAFDEKGNLYVAESDYNRVRQIGADGIIQTTAGSGPWCFGAGGFSGDGGGATSARLNTPWSVASDLRGRLYIADTNNHRIRLLSPNGVIVTVAGTGQAGFSGDGGPAQNAALNAPRGIAVDRSGNLYIADTGNHRVRKVTPEGRITTLAGTGAPGFSGDGGPASAAQLTLPWGVTLDARGNLFIADTGNHRVRKVTPAGVITTVAGNGVEGSMGDGAAAALAQVNAPVALAGDVAGDLFIAEQGSGRVRKVDANGIISTIAGGGATDTPADGSIATTVRFNSPSGIALDSSGNLFIADTGNQRVREVFGVGGAGLIAGLSSADAVAPPLQISVKAETGVPGEVIEVEISTDETLQDLNALQFTVKSDLLDFSAGAGGISGSLTDSPNWLVSASAIRPGEVTVGAIGAAAEDVKGLIARVSARIDPAAPPGDYPLTLVGVQAFDSSRQAIPVQGAPETLTVRDQPIHPVRVRAQNVAGSAGQTVNVEIYVDSALANLAGAQLTVQYGSIGTVQASSITKGPLIGDANWTAAVNDLNPGEVTLGAVGVTPQTGPGLLATVPIQIASTTPPGSYGITLSSVVLLDTQGKRIASQALPGLLTVSPPAPIVPGDVNNDQAVTVADATLALRAAVGLATLNSQQQATVDINGDGSVDVRDATLILRKAVGL